MIFKTRTSEYKLEKANGFFTLTKISLLDNSTSRVEPGRAFTGKEVGIIGNGCFFIENMHTSPVQNIEELITWLRAQGVQEDLLTYTKPADTDK